MINPDGSGPTRLASGTGASWSPDGTQLVFVRHGRDGRQDVYLLNADGSGELRLTTGLATREQSLSAGWSPDGEMLAVQRSGREPFAVFLVSARGGSVVKLADNACGATWSPDGSRLAYLQSRDLWDAHPALFVASANGTGKHRIPLPWAVTGVAAAVWSPVGDRIALLTSQYRPYLIDPDGGEALKLADLTVESGPVWAPAGDRLTFVAEGSGSTSSRLTAVGPYSSPTFPPSMRWRPSPSGRRMEAGSRIPWWAGLLLALRRSPTPRNADSRLQR